MTTDFFWNSKKNWSEFFSKIRWPRNSYEILQEFWSEFWWQALVSNNSDDYQILQEIDDHGILMKDFDPNSGCQENPDLNTDQKIRWPRNCCEIPREFWSGLFSKIRWPRNSYEVLEGFRS